MLFHKRNSAFRASALVLSALCAVGCASSPRQSPDANSPTPAPASAQQNTGSADSGSVSTSADTGFVMPDISRFTRLQSGLLYYDVTVGTGIAAVNLREVQVHYTGMLQDGTIFDTSRQRGVPIKFTLGEGKVIRGWEQGLRGMRVGGRRLLVIPPELAYGSAGSGPIPANATLIFDLQLVSVR